MNLPFITYSFSEEPGKSNVANKLFNMSSLSGNKSLPVNLNEKVK